MARAAVWLGFIFRGEIRKLLGRVQSLKYKDLEAKFEKELAAAEAEAKNVFPKKDESKALEEEPVYPAPYDERYAQLLRIADESPRAALLEAWVEVEASLAEASDRLNLSTSPRTPPRKLVIELINTGRFTQAILPLFEDLRNLRNEAAHAPKFIPTKRQTRRYLQMAMELSLTFQYPLDVN